MWMPDKHAEAPPTGRISSVSFFRGTVIEEQTIFSLHPSVNQVQTFLSLVSWT